MKNNTKIIPVVTYSNIDIDKSKVYKDNKGKLGVIVKIFDKKGNLLNIFPTITSAAKYFGVSNSTISCIPNKGLFKNYMLKF